jgi:hypothetical protein
LRHYWGETQNNGRVTYRLPMNRLYLSGKNAKLT